MSSSQLYSSTVLEQVYVPWSGDYVQIIDSLAGWLGGCLMREAAGKWWYARTERWIRKNNRQMEGQTACQTDCCCIDHVIGQYIALSETLSATIGFSQAVCKNRKTSQLVFSVRACGTVHICTDVSRTYPWIWFPNTNRFLPDQPGQEQVTAIFRSSVYA